MKGILNNFLPMKCHEVNKSKKHFQAINNYLWSNESSIIFYLDLVFKW